MNVSKPKVTVLTDPLPWGSQLFIEAMRRIARHIRDGLHRRQYFNHPKYRGHFAVTRSLVEGLEAIEASFNYNPRFPWEIADRVVVLAGVRTLRQAIELKRQGRIKKLFAGPNIVVFSSDHDSLIASPLIDAVITPSDFVNKLYLEDNPSLRGRIFSWPAGVDTDYWQPDLLRINNRITVFDKRSETDEPLRVNPYIDFLIHAGWQVDVLVRSRDHGYTPEQYRKLLRNSCLMIGFTVGSESQGIAWTEAWSTDVPTLILRNNSNILKGRRYSCSTAPYLNQMNGLFFDDLEDFKVQFSHWESHRDQFTPRAWTLVNMSDEVCASMLYKKVLEC